MLNLKLGDSTKLWIVVQHVSTDFHILRVLHTPTTVLQNLCTKSPNTYCAVEEQMCFVASFPGLPCFLFFDMCLAHTEKRQQGRPRYEATLLVSILQANNSHIIIVGTCKCSRSQLFPHTQIQSMEQEV